MVMACKEGKLQVLKLLVGTVADMNVMSLFSYTLASLEQQLTPPAAADSTNSKAIEALVSIAYYLYLVDSTMIMSLVVRSANDYPNGALKLLREFNHLNQHEEHFLMTGVALVSLPIQWIATCSFTHIKLSNNLLSAVPDELFQIRTLQGLHLSHNCLEAIPSVLKWNCPKLKDLDISHNRLLSKPYTILEGKKNKEQKLDSNLPSIGKQRNVISAAQSLLNLTGYNLYPCLCSISRVNIGHNTSLTQVSL